MVSVAAVYVLGCRAWTAQRERDGLVNFVPASSSSGTSKWRLVSPGRKVSVPLVEV